MSISSPAIHSANSTEPQAGTVSGKFAYVGASNSAAASACTQASDHSAALQVSCLCAQWCGTCRDYAAFFASLQAEFPQVAFRWVDIEDESDLVEPVDVDNFPCILISDKGKAQFFGSITPHPDTLRRLIQNQLQDAGQRSLGSEVQALAERIQMHKA